MEKCGQCGDVVIFLEGGSCGGRGSLYGCEHWDCVFEQVTGGIIATPGGESFERSALYHSFKVYVAEAIEDFLKARLPEYGFGIKTVQGLVGKESDYDSAYSYLKRLKMLEEVVFYLAKPIPNSLSFKRRDIIRWLKAPNDYLYDVAPIDYIKQAKNDSDFSKAMFKVRI